MSIHILAGFVVNKGFLFATSSRKIKSHVVESQITLLVWPYLSLTEKFAQLITWLFLMTQSASFTSAAFEAFAEAYLCFLVSASAKKNAEVIRFLGILKKYVSKNKIYFCSRKKSKISLNEKVIFVFTQFSNLMYYPQMSVFSFFTFFYLIYQSLKNGT